MTPARGRMRIAGRAAALATAMLLLVASCTSGGGPAPSPRPGLPRGGTLRVGMTGPFLSFRESPSPVALDPQAVYETDSWEVFRCCLLRTLLSTKGAPTRDGGAELRPDLASGPPTVSPDGLTWTFRIRAGLHYAPPLQDTEITAPDFIRALEREAHLGTAASYANYYTPITGFEGFASGASDSIPGLEAPNPHTLVVRLDRPVGDLGYRLGLPAAAPIPPRPGDPGAALGVATGHDEDYGAFLVSSGPYMVEGAGSVDFTAPPGRQRPASGFVPQQSLTLVRNPSWSAATDPLRPANVDRVELTFVGDLARLSRDLDAGRLDLVLAGGAPPQAPMSQVERYRADPSLGRVLFEPSDSEFFITMNVAVPPFDDVHVRRAVNHAIDRRAAVDIYGGTLFAQVATHGTPDSLEANELLTYRPYGRSDGSSDPERAAAEMAASAYDEDRDGVCDAAVCAHVHAPTFKDRPFPAIGRRIAADLDAIGIHLDVDPVPPPDYFGMVGDPSTRTPIGLSTGWGKDYLDASTFLVPLASSSGFTMGSGYSVLGATRAQLRSWGYGVTSVPSVDDRVAECVSEVGDRERRCWIALDQYLMETIVPWAPLVIEGHVQIVPARVVGYSFDQWTARPALERIALEP